MKRTTSFIGPKSIAFRLGIGLALLLLLKLLAMQPVLAQGIVTPQHTEPTWQATYWNNMTLSGTPALVRQDSVLDFDWGTGSPDPTIHANQFSARWQKYIDVPPGDYQFVAESDDGIRVWVDSELIIDAWNDHSITEYRANKYLGSGHHLVRVEYYENGGLAVARLSWFALTAPTPTPPPTPNPAQEWMGEYFNNMSLSGTPVVVRGESSIDYDWGTGSPIPGQVRPDNFSVRWTRTQTLGRGNYHFVLTVDDGARLFVNGHLLIDAWFDQPPTQYTGDIFLPDGPITIQLEYYERTGGATARLSWSPGGPAPIQNWRGEYFNNRTLSGTPALVRDDAKIDFDWATGSPDAQKVNADDFSVRWSRTLDLPAGTYRFTMRVDDGGRVFLNNQLQLDAWWDQAITEYHFDYHHPGGPLDVRMEYYEHKGLASAHLDWSLAPSPTAVIVDDLDPGFHRGGSAYTWSTANEGYANHLFWTRNNDYARYMYNWARWAPTLQPGRYEVFAYIPNRYTTTARARYWVRHAGQFTLRIVDQSANGGRWVSLGTYTFTGDGTEYVSLADVTYEPYLSRLVAWDAMKWEPR
jgi:hypothetical protein